MTLSKISPEVRIAGVGEKRYAFCFFVNRLINKNFRGYTDSIYNMPYLTPNFDDL